MSVHKRKNNGTYFVAYRDAEGNQRTKSFGKGREGKRQANNFDEDMKASRKLGTPPPMVSVKEEKVYLDQLAQRYLNAKKAEGKRVGWLKELKAILEKHLIPVFDQRPVEQLKYDEIVSVFTKTYPACSPISRGRYISYLKAIFQYGVDHELINRNPLARWKKLKERPRDMQLTIEDLERVMAVAKPHLKWALEVAYHLGVRTGPAELLSLKWTAVDWAGCDVRVYSTKTKTTRVIPVSPEFLERLRVMKDQARSEFVVEYKGKPVKRLDGSFKSAQKAAGLPYRAVMYEVRHLFASTLIRGGSDVAAVSKLMGHSTIKMTVDNYYHLLEDEKRKSILRLPRLKTEGVKEVSQAI